MKIFDVHDFCIKYDFKYDYNKYVKHISDDSKIIIEVYKLFYNQDPDFSDKNIGIKIQAMLSILSEFGVSISDYSFSLCGSKNITMSINLSNLIYELFLHFQNILQ